MADRTKPVVPLAPAPSGPNWPAEMTRYTSDQFLELYKLVNGGLRWQNLRANLLTVTTEATASSPFLVPHTLGKVPELFVANLDGPGSVWATVADRLLWSASTLTLRSDRPSAALTLLVI